MDVATLEVQPCSLTDPLARSLFEPSPCMCGEADQRMQERERATHPHSRSFSLASGVKSRA